MLKVGAGFWHVWFCSLRSFLVATVAVAVPRQPAGCEEVGQGYEERHRKEPEVESECGEPS